MLARVLAALSLGLAACSGEADDPPVLPARGANDVAAATPPSALDAVRAPEPVRADPAPTLELEGGDVVVTVVRPDGAPATGVRVLGCDVDDAGAIEGRLRWGLGIETDAFGRAVLPERRTGERYAAALFGGVPALSTADAPAHIALPPTGSIHVDLEPYDCPADLRIVSGLHGGRAIELEVPESGVLDIPRVPLGEFYDITLRSHGDDTNATLRGPREPGQTVVLALPLRRILSVRARVLDLDGTPCSAASVLIRSTAGERVLELARDGDLFQGRLSSYEWGEPESVLLVRPTARSTDPHPYAIVAVPAPDAQRVVDLGTVELTPLPTVVAGRVVDTAGNGVSGAFVQARPRAAGTPSAPWVPPHPKLTSDVGFGPLSATVAVAGPDGRFELCAHPAERWAPGDVLDLRVRPGGSADLPRRIYRAARAGDRDVRIAVAPKGTIALDASHLHPAVREQVHAILRRSDGVGEPRALGKLDTGCEAQVEAGTYDIDFSLGGEQKSGTGPLIGRLQRVSVPAGGRCVDDRLTPLEAPFELVPHEFRVVDRGRKPAWTFRVCYRGEGTESWCIIDGMGPDEEGCLVWLAPRTGGVRAAIQSRDHGCVELTDLPTGATIEAPGVEYVTLEFEGPPLPQRRKWPVLRPVGTDLPLEDQGLHREVDAWRVRVQRGARYVLDVREPVSDWQGVEVAIPREGDRVVVECAERGRGAEQGFER